MQLLNNFKIYKILKLECKNIIAKQLQVSKLIQSSPQALEAYKRNGLEDRLTNKLSQAKQQMNEIENSSLLIRLYSCI